MKINFPICESETDLRLGLNETHLRPNFSMQFISIYESVKNLRPATAKFYKIKVPTYIICSSADIAVLS